jgi:hypothetical protein
MKKILNLILVLIVLTPLQAQKFDLSLNLEEGKEYKQVMNSKATIDQSINGQEMNMEISIKGGMSYKVISVNPTDYDLEVKYESLSMAMNTPHGKMEYSSDKNNEGDIFSTLLSKMTGHTFNVKLAQNGEIQEVQNIESRIESLFEDLDHIPEAQIAQLKNQMTKTYGEESFKGNIEMATAIFPKKPVKKGDKWTIKSNMQAGMPAVITTEYELTEVTDEYAVIKGNSVINTSDKNLEVEAVGMSMKLDLAGTMGSVIKVDRESGWIIEAKINQEIKGGTNIKNNDQMPEGMKMTMKMVNEMMITN